MKKIRLITLILFFMLGIIYLASQSIAATYKYDALNRLVEVTYDSGQKIKYTYDNGGNILSVDYTWVLRLNPIGDKIINAGRMLTFTVSATTVEGFKPIYSAYNLPEGAAFNNDTGVFSWTPDYNQVGIYEKICFEARAGETVVTEEINITVLSVNTPVGEDIKVVDEETGTTITFDNVEKSGNTSVSVSHSVPEGTPFEANLIPIYYDIVTDAEFIDKVRIKVDYDPTAYDINENDLRLYQLKDGKTIDITYPINPGPEGNPNTETNTIEGMVEHFCIFAAGIPNRAPVANAGLDQTIEVQSSDTVEITLDGSLSYDPDSELLKLERPNVLPDGRSIVRYIWAGPFGEVEGVSPTVTIPVGEWECLLTVSDGRLESQDTVKIHVKDMTEFTYALFSGSENNPITINSSNTNIIGDIHTNNDFVFQGSKLNLEGICQSAGKIQVRGAKIDIDNQVENAEIIEMPECSLDIKSIAMKDGEYFDSDKKYNGNKITLQKNVIVNGNLTINGSSLSAAGFIVAAENVSFNTSSCSNASEERIVICSEHGNITLNGSNYKINGLIYAPRGTVTINSASFTLNGRIVADRIIIRGSKINITNNFQDIKNIYGRADVTDDRY